MDYTIEYLWLCARVYKYLINLGVSIYDSRVNDFFLHLSRNLPHLSLSDMSLIGETLDHSIKISQNRNNDYHSRNFMLMKTYDRLIEYMKEATTFQELILIRNVTLGTPYLRLNFIDHYLEAYSRIIDQTKSLNEYDIHYLIKAKISKYLPLDIQYKIIKLLDKKLDFITNATLFTFVSRFNNSLDIFDDIISDLKNRKFTPLEIEIFNLCYEGIKLYPLTKRTCFTYFSSKFTEEQFKLLLDNSAPHNFNWKLQYYLILHTDFSPESDILYQFHRQGYDQWSYELFMNVRLRFYHTKSFEKIKHDKFDKELLDDIIYRDYHNNYIVRIWISQFCHWITNIDLAPLTDEAMDKFYRMSKQLNLLQIDCIENAAKSKLKDRNFRATMMKILDVLKRKKDELLTPEYFNKESRSNLVYIFRKNLSNKSNNTTIMHNNYIKSRILKDIKEKDLSLDETMDLLYTIRCDDNVTKDYIETTLKFLNESNNNGSNKLFKALIYHIYTFEYEFNDEMLKDNLFRVLRKFVIKDNQINQFFMTDYSKCIRLCLFLIKYNEFSKELSDFIFNVNFIKGLEDTISNNRNYELLLRSLFLALNRAVYLRLPEYNVPWLHEKLSQDPRLHNFNSIIEYEDIFEVLLEVMNGDDEYIQQDFITPFGNHIHFLISFLKNNSGRRIPILKNNINSSDSDRLENYAILINERSRWPSISEISKELEIQGYIPIIVNTLYWNSLEMSNNKAKVEFLKNNLNFNRNCPSE